MLNKTRIAAVVAAAAATMTLGMGGAAASTSANAETGAQNKAPISVAGTNATAKKYNSTGTILLGTAAFKEIGEFMTVCDEHADSRGVWGELWYYGKLQFKRYDNNGSASPCNVKQFEMAEEQPIKIRVCVEGVGCSGWAYGRS